MNSISQYPRFMIEDDYPERLEEIVEWFKFAGMYKSKAYQTLFANCGGDDEKIKAAMQDAEVSKRILEAATLEAFGAAVSLKTDADIVSVVFLTEIEKHRMWESAESWETIEEFLEYKMRGAGAGEVSNLKYMAKHILPLLIRAGGNLTPAQVMDGIREHWYNMREATPIARRAIENYAKTEKSMQSEIQRVESEFDSAIRNAQGDEKERLEELKKERINEYKQVLDDAKKNATDVVVGVIGNAASMSVKEFESSVGKSKAAASSVGTKVKPRGFVANSRENVYVTIEIPYEEYSRYAAVLNTISDMSPADPKSVINHIAKQIYGREII